MPRLSENMRAAAFMMLSMAGFAFNDAMIKLAAADLGFFQAIFLRGLAATALVTVLAARMGALAHRPGRRDRRLIGWRTLGEVGSTFCFLTALFNMPIADATAILQSVPLAVTLAAALFLGEPVGWRRYLAIAIGFLGMLVIVRPGAEGFNAHALWAVAAVGFIVLRDLTTRRLSPAVPSLLVSVVAASIITLSAGALAAVTEWRAVTPWHLAVLGIAAGSLSVGYLFGIMTMRIGEIGFTQPFRYSVLLWAIVFGVVFFAERPDALTLIGAALVIGTGLFTFHRERILARRDASLAAARLADPR